MKRSSISKLKLITKKISDIPVKLYRNGALIMECNSYQFKDNPYLKDEGYVEDIQDDISYYINDYNYFYGIINYAGYKIITGPVRHIGPTAKELEKMADGLNLNHEDSIIFKSQMLSIKTMTFESFIKKLTWYYTEITGIKKDIEDVILHKAEQKELENLVERKKTIKAFTGKDEKETKQILETFYYEQSLFDCVEKGDMDRLDSILKNAPALREGQMAKEQLRHAKNICIIISSLASRAAIRGGMDVADALMLTDTYIQKCEESRKMEEIMNIQYNALTEYTKIVSEINKLGKENHLTIQVNNYINQHIAERITTEKIAEALYLSRSYLSIKFKEESGMTLNDFIKKKKTDEAIRLMDYSSMSLSEISNYLVFSSQSHFSRVFKKMTGKTPKEYQRQK